MDNHNHVMTSVGTVSAMLGKQQVSTTRTTPRGSANITESLPPLPPYLCEDDSDFSPVQQLSIQLPLGILGVLGAVMREGGREGGRAGGIGSKGGRRNGGRKEGREGGQEDVPSHQRIRRRRTLVALCEASGQEERKRGARREEGEGEKTKSWQ